MDPPSRIVEIHPWTWRLEFMSPKALHFVLEEMLAWAPARVLARHRYGCRVLDRLRVTTRFFKTLTIPKLFLHHETTTICFFCLGNALKCSSNGRHNISQETNPSTTEPGNRNSHIYEYYRRKFRSETSTVEKQR